MTELEFGFKSLSNTYEDGKGPDIQLPPYLQRTSKDVLSSQVSPHQVCLLFPRLQQTQGSLLRRERQEDGMVAWHHRLNRHNFEQTLEGGRGQGSLVCRSPWGCQELDATEQLNNKEHTHTDVLTSNGPSDLLLNLPFLWYTSWMPRPASTPIWGSKIFSIVERTEGRRGLLGLRGLKDYLVQWFSKGICSPGKTHMPGPCPGRTESPGAEGQGLGKT